LVWVFASGGVAGIMFFIVIFYLISSLISVSKALETEEFRETLISPTYKINREKWQTIMVMGLLLFFVAIYVDPSKPKLSKAELISQTVTEAKSNIIFPNKLDDYTVLTDITPELNGIQYHYLVTGIEPSDFPEEEIKSNISQNICDTPEMIYLLNKDIDMQYSYSIENFTDTYSFTFSKKDCI
jgi:hypothetical protein